MKKALIAAVVVALITAAGGSARSTQQTLTYKGVKCFKQSSSLVCGLTNGTGYVAGISSSENDYNYLLVQKFNGTHPVFTRSMPNAPVEYIAARSDRLIGSGIVCQKMPSTGGVECVPSSGVGYGFSMTRTIFLVLNLDTNQTVFTRYTG